MKEQNTIKKFYSSDLFYLCNKEQFFTDGDIKQYNKFFAVCDKGVTIKELVIMLYMCSSQNEDYIYSVCETFFEKCGSAVTL